MVTTHTWPRWFSAAALVAVVLSGLPIVSWSLRIWFGGMLGGAAAALLAVPIAVTMGVFALRRHVDDADDMPGVDRWLTCVLLVQIGLLYHFGDTDFGLLLAGLLFPVLVFVWVWGTFRWTTATQLIFPVCFSLFFLPWEYFIRDGLELQLQIWTADIAFWLLDTVGYEVWYFNEYTIDSEPFYVIVNETCSGVNMLVTLAMYTLVFGWLVQPNWRGRALLLAFVFPLAMLANGVRVMVIFLLGYYGGIEWADGFWHTGSAYVIFMPIFWVIYRLNQIYSDYISSTHSAPRPG